MKKDVLVNDLNEMIDNIDNLHSIVSKNWMSYAVDKKIPIFNQKSEKVCELDDDNLITTIIEYGLFLNGISIQNRIDWKNTNDFTTNYRIKTPNSIMDKYYDYCNYGPHNGKVPVNKCFNDVFGARVIIGCQELNLSDIEKIVNHKNNIKLEDKNFDGINPNEMYRAAHIYFKGKENNEENNKMFRWELQIWKKSQEAVNHKSHLSHRFKYRYWESKVKRDV